MLNSTLRMWPGFYMLCSLYVAYYICVYKKAEELMIRKEPHPDITLLLHNASGKLSLILFLFNGGKNCHMKNLKKKKKILHRTVSSSGIRVSFFHPCGRYAPLYGVTAR